jgi:predicted hotdog family 3-hydroxylacyl-ACP dehydratase
MRVEDLVPHSGDMSLLDTVVAFNLSSLHATARIEKSNPFVTAGTVSSWIGIEYMAQAIAAWAGAQARQKGEPVKLGFLLGTRKYEVTTDSFPLLCNLDIHVELLMDGANGLSVFECRIMYEGGEATANINVFQPDDIEEFLQGQ